MYFKRAKVDKCFCSFVYAENYAEKIGDKWLTGYGQMMINVIIYKYCRFKIKYFYAEMFLNKLFNIKIFV